MAALKSNVLVSLRHRRLLRNLALLVFAALVMSSSGPGQADEQPPCPYNLCQVGQSCNQWYNGDPAGLCCITACDAGQRTTDLNPPFPRVAFMRPVDPQTDYINCQPSGPSDGATPYIHSRYDLVAFAGLGDGCRVPNSYNLQGRPFYANSQELAREIKAYSPATIVLGKAGYSPLHLYDDAPPEYFVMKDRTTVSLSPVDPSSTSLSVGDTSWLYDKKGWLAFLNGDTMRFNAIEGDELQGLWGLDFSHPAGSTLKQPVEVFGYTPNLMPFNPLADYREVARLAVDQRYAGLTPQDLEPFDGVLYSEMRDRILCADDLCGADYYGHGDFGADFDNDGVRDCNCDDTAQYSMAELTEQWKIGVRAMFEYERQVLQELMPGRQPILVSNSGDPADNYMADFMSGFLLEYLRKIWTWEGFVEKLQYWEQHAPQPHAVILLDTVKEGDYPDYVRDGRNDFAQMRYGLATAMMGDAYFARNFGWYNYIGLWFDEYETDLGYPTSPPIRLPDLCTDSQATGIPPDWATYTCIHVRFFDKGAVIVNPTGSPQTVTEADLRRAWQLAGFSTADFPTYYRLRGGQDPDFNNGQRFLSVALRGDPGPRPDGNGDDKGDAILLFTRPTIAVADIIVGNWHNDDTSPGSNPVELEPREAWSTIRYSDEKYGANPYYTQWVAGWTEEGTPYFYTSGPGKTATFRPTIGVPGKYAVYEWHGWHADRGEKPETHQEASNLQALIRHAQGTTQVVVDQTRNYGQWNYLGTYTFNRGTEGYVRYITDGADGVVIADAVMFRYLGGPGPAACTGDLNEDGALDALDLQALISLILAGDPGGACADLNGDGQVDQADIRFLVDRILNPAGEG